MNANHRLKLIIGALISAFLCWRFFPRYSFAGKVAIVTGGSRGLGFALARDLVRQGAKVALVARDKQELERARIELNQYDGLISTWCCDLKNEALVQATVKEIAQSLGAIDILINNAGEIVVGPLESMERKDFEDALAIHFWAPFSMTFAALPYLKRRRQARIVNIASFGGKIAVPHLTPYCVSKFALVGFSQALRTELAQNDIHNTTVTPGLMRTGSHKNAFFKGQHEKEFAWFSLGAGNPLSAMGAKRAAHQILNAVRRGDAEITVTLVARIAVIAQVLFPNSIARILTFAASMMPKMPRAGGTAVRTGWESESSLSPSALTWFGDRATELFNGLRGHSSAGKR